MVSQAVARFASDAVLIVGGARAILLQVADPTIAAGVARHSDFANRPLERLHNTLTFAYAVVLGSEAQATKVAGFVARAHGPVARADDAELQLWVAATLYDTAALVHLTVYGPSQRDVSDDVYREYERLGTALQMPAHLWPASRSDFDTYRDARIADLRVTADARRIAHDLFHPITAPRWLRLGLPLARLLTIDLLPPQFRKAYRFRHGPIRRGQARLAWAVIRVVATLLPARVKSLPARRYLAKLRP
jgi:uncharacterized protein (DUF2236 family)